MSTKLLTPAELKDEDGPEYLGTATYSPEDNKLRLYAFARLDGDVYARVKSAGFSWAPKQKLFVAPMWTPQRYDLLVELCGEVGDEDSTLADRAEFRAERFEGYKENRVRDAHQAAAKVAELTDGMPLGQPILVGHHSEKKARKHAEKVNREMAFAVDMWSRASYWKVRVAAVRAHADFKADEGVRHRRIKGLEADQRKMLKERDEALYWAEKWADPELPIELAWRMADVDRSGAYDILRSEGAEHKAPVSPEVMAKARAKAIAVHEHRAQWPTRWLDHIALRLAYERELMEQGGGQMTDRWAHVQPGGRVTLKRWGADKWYTIVRVNRKEGRVVSVTVSSRYVPVRGVEEIIDYQEPEEGAAEQMKKATKPAPLCNYRTEGCVEMTAAQWKEEHARGLGHYIERVEANEQHGKHRRRSASGPRWTRVPVFITDAKVVPPPAFNGAAAVAAVIPEPIPAATIPRPVEPKPEPTAFDAMAATLKAGGAQAVAAHQLFPTPPELAARMVELADLEAGMCVLEPSAGTGNLVQAVLDAVDTEVLGYEINQGLCSHLSMKFPDYQLQVRCRDFLEVTDFQGQYPRVLMNPPFENASDIKHIMHALTFLRPGGRLVAICANGPRQRDQLMPIASHWEDLPPGTFKNAGTGVNTALLVINK